MKLALLLAALILASVLALRARRMLNAALWLAAASAFLALALAELGAIQIAVIELSVGAGLVTVLFLFAISIAGDDALQAKARLPYWLTLGLVLASGVLLGWYLWSGTPAASAASQMATANTADFYAVVWQGRALDALVQIVLIFSGVLALLGLLAETRAPLDGAPADEYIAQRQQELNRMQAQATVRQEAR
jgi:NADH:ubiquinone oxidoreductase subunit 6 (subunit J)